MAGYIARFKTKKFIIIEILDVESLQMIVGYYLQYSDIEEVYAKLPFLTKHLAKLTSRNTANLPGISVPPFEAKEEEIDENDAQILAHIISCELVESGKYAVLPRTESVDKVLEEQQRQREGTTDPDRMSRLGKGRNARFVLAGSIQKIVARKCLSPMSWESTDLL